MDWTSSLVSIGTGIVVAIVTAKVTVSLALKRFYSEKWWERKSAAYTAIIEALHHVREHADTNLVFHRCDKDIPPDGEKKLTEELQSAMAELRKQRDLGTFIVSEEAINVLSELFAELDASTNTTHWESHLVMKLDTVDKCLPKMREIARHDLELR